MSDDDHRDIAICPFCGKSWVKPEKSRVHRWLKEVERTAIVMLTTTGMVFLLKFFGI